MSTTEKRHDIIADTLTISEMATILSGLRGLLPYAARHDRYHWAMRHDYYEVIDLIQHAHDSAVRNEYAGDYDYPDDAE